jgi:TRAP-type uncharacterized transport system substrate-binding protein
MTFSLPAKALGFLLALGATASAQTQPPQVAPVRQEPSRYLEQKRETNDIAVSIMVAGLTCTCARFAEDIRNVVNDLRPGGLRVLPILGIGGFQNVNDILFLRGVDMGTVDQDNLKLLKKKDPDLYRNLENKVHYITKLYNAEFHVLAKTNITSLADLKGKVVNFNLKDSQTHVTAENIFGMLGLEVAQKTHYDNDLAIQKLGSGEIAAMIVLTGAPQSALQKVKKEDGYHFVPITEANLPGYDLGPVLDEYLPAELTSELYPNLVEPGKSVPTLANRALLAAYNWPEDSDRYRRVARFVQEFFGRIDKFRDKSRHPKWREINLAAEVPGWTRFKAAQEWLNGNRLPVAVNDPAGGDEVKTSFAAFLDKYQTTSGRVLSDPEKDKLFREFKQFMDNQAGGRRAAR